MFSIGGVVLATHEAISGSIPAPGTGPQRWAFANAYGLSGRIKQLVGRDAPDIDIHVLLDDATVAALKPISEAALPVVVVHDRALAGVLMTMTTFVPVWNATEQGDAWDTHIVLVEE